MQTTIRHSVAKMLIVALALTFPPSSLAFYLPGLAPTSYGEGAVVPLNVNALTPSVTARDDQLHAIVSLDYYYPLFHFCRPDGNPKDVQESLGSVIFGDRIQSSRFELHMAKNETCKTLCNSTFDAISAQFVNEKIWDGYDVNWLIDGLPAAQPVEDSETKERFWSPGFPLGRLGQNEDPILHNHYKIITEYHKAGLSGDQYRVVGVIVEPESYRDQKSVGDGEGECGDSSQPLVLNENGETKVRWTYSVEWRLSDTAWATRWDRYLHVYNPKVHWFSLINATVFVVLLVAMVGMVLLRALRKDIERYNRFDSYNLDDLSGTSVAVEDEVQEDSGWKLVHGDVFRSAPHSLLLSVLLGNGAQLFLMTGVTLAFALLGFLSPSNRGFLTTTILVLYAIFGFVGGYVSSRAYKTFGGDRWKVNISLTPVLVPVIVFSTFFFLNLWVWGKGSSGAVPLTTMIAIVALWFIISVPLSVAGSWIAFKQAAIPHPTQVNQIPRQIPPCAASLRPVPSMLMTGLLPFVAIFVELFYIMNSIWTNKIYYMFGFLFVCYGLMIITTACTTILLVYFMLCAEDYRWHWRAFFGAGMTGLYVFIMALGFWMRRVSFGGLTGAVLYVGYSALVAFLVMVLTGSMGYLASYAFVRRIYGSIKVD